MHYHYFTLEQRDALERLIRDQGGGAELLYRLHSPEYGVCGSCGADIAYTSLMKSPATRYCANCQPKT
ncbi:MAG TPA: TraR/DksA C4-type zinc finger protein [Burkholderiales bacterium]